MAGQSRGTKEKEELKSQLVTFFGTFALLAAAWYIIAGVAGGGDAQSKSSTVYYTGLMRPKGVTARIYADEDNHVYRGYNPHQQKQD